MSPVLEGLAPVFCLIALGWAVRAGGIVTSAAFAAVNRFGYFVLYPAFLFLTITGAEIEFGDAATFLFSVVVGFGAMALLALATLSAFRRDGPGFTSVFQGVTRWNGFALLAAAPSLYGPRGAAYIAFVFGPIVLLVNVMCVAVLARWGQNGVSSRSALVGQIMANPLVLACAAGLIVRGAGGFSLPIITPTLNLLAPAAMPVALLCVGAGLDLAAARRGGGKLATASVLKLVAGPFVLWGAARVFGADPATAAIAAGLGATPTAAAAYTLARELGGNAELMAAIITVTTLASFVTMPLILGFLTP